MDAGRTNEDNSKFWTKERRETSDVVESLMAWRTEDEGVASAALFCKPNDCTLPANRQSDRGRIQVFMLVLVVL